MNNARMWLVVKPTVGIPLFLSAVAIGSFAVHVAVLSNTSWVADFLSGKPLGSGSTAMLERKDTVQPAKFVDFTAEGKGMLIRLEDGTLARVELQVPAAYSPPSAQPSNKANPPLVGG